MIMMLRRHRHETVDAMIAGARGCPTRLTLSLGPTAGVTAPAGQSEHGPSLRQAECQADTGSDISTDSGSPGRRRGGRRCAAAAFELY